MAQKISFWLLITLVLTLGFGQLLRFEYLGLPIYLHDILVVCILCIELSRSLLNRNSRLQVEKGSAAADRRLLKVPSAIKIFLAGLTFSWHYALTQYPTSDLLVPSLYTLRLLAYLALYFVIKRSNLTIPRSTFMLTGLVTLIIGLTQYFFMPDMRIFQYLGWDDHLSRLTLLHFDPTFNAVMLSLSVLSFAPTRSYILYPLFLLPILLTYSRSVWLSLLLTGVFSMKNKKIILVSSILLLASIFALPRKFGEGTNLLRTYSITSRFDSDLTYIQKYKWELLTGHGMNTLILDSPSSDLPNHASGPNNSYLYLLTTTGLLGLIGWGSLCIQSTKSPPNQCLHSFYRLTLQQMMFYPLVLLWIFPRG
jgi:hypothetical protein